MGRANVQYQSVELISELLLPWLDENDGKTSQLARWLQGYDLPDLGGGEEPYVWLLYGLPIGGDRYLRESQLAERTARLIDEKPDILRPGDMPEKLLYNLLLLASGLSAPTQLAEPLYALYERDALEGQWLGIELNDALLFALIPNQVDNRLYDIWKLMLEGGEHERLKGNEFDGFEGVLWMPQSKLTRGEPDMESIGHALWIMSSHLDKTRSRRIEFTALLNKVQDVYFDHPTWKIDLLVLANKYNWPTWAVECLPDLSIFIGDVAPQVCQSESHQAEDCKRLIVWWPFTKVLEAGVDVADFWFKTEKSFCNKQVFQIILPQSEMQFITELASFVEPYRVGNPFPSSSSVVGNIADAMSAYKGGLGQNDRWGKVIEKAHKDIWEER